MLNVFISSLSRKEKNMPRIIENVKERAIIEARKVLEKEGYQALTVRGIADALAIGLGTVYNYFPSKDHLVACVILEDWMSLIREKDWTEKRISSRLSIIMC